MTISEYTPERADALNKLNIPEAEAPINIKILWVELLTADNIYNRIYTETHSHSAYEMHFILSGRADYEYNGKAASIHTNEALFIPPEVLHKYTGCSKDMLKFSITFSLGKAGLSSEIFNDIAAQLLTLSDDVTDNINSILKYSDKKDFFAPGIISGRILEIIYSVCGSLKIKLPQTDDNKIPARVLVAKEYIDNNKHRIIKCEDVAKECCLSSKQLNRIFKSCTGSSVFEYIISSKIKYAKKLLSQKEYSIKEISFMLGFENECIFVSYFKRHCDMPPGAFRKQLFEQSNNPSLQTKMSVK